LKKDYQILIIFDTNISDTTSHQMAVQFSIAPTVCFCNYLGKQKTTKYCIFTLFHLSGFHM